MEKIINRFRKYTLNEHAFDEITPESAYWIGFLMADGCVSLNQIIINLQEKDINHLIKFNSFLKTNYPIKMIKSGYNSSSLIASLVVSSKYITNRLSEYGVTPRKSLTAKVCDELAFNRDFWRGVVDGDGTLFLGKKEYSYPQLNLGGSYHIINQYKYFIQSLVNCDPKIEKIKSIFMLKISGKKAQKIIDTLYKNADIYLERKFLKSQDIIKFKFKR